MYNQPPPSVKKNNNVLWIILAVLAVCGCGGVVVIGAILFPVFEQAKMAATKTLALSHAKQSATGMLMYAADNNDRLPPGDQWMDRCMPYIRDDEAFQSPEVSKRDASGYGFAFRKGMAGGKTEGFVDMSETAMIFDSTVTQRNAYAGLETLPSPPRYGTGDRATNTIAFLDGHAKATTEKAAKNLPPLQKSFVK
jgi:hypothetical protein